MKNNKESAFTLIEMLIVVVIIGIVLSIVIASGTSLLNNRSKKAYDIHIDLVDTATKMYIDRYNGQLINDNSTCFNINYNTLLSENLLKENDIKCNGNIIITKENKNKFKSDFYLTCVDENDNVVNTSPEVPSGCKNF